MTKDKFNQLEKIDKVKYINDKLKDGYSLTKISPKSWELVEVP